MTNMRYASAPVEHIRLTFTVANHNVLVWLTATVTYSPVPFMIHPLYFTPPLHILALHTAGCVRWNWIPQNQSWRGGRPGLWAFSRKCLKIHIIGSGRVAGVGKLSASAKNAFNSFVGRVFANSRQKTLFFRVLPKLQQKGSFYLVLPSFYLVLPSFT